MQDDSNARTKVDALLDTLMFWASILIALVLAVAVLFAGGWLFQVPFGDKTTTEYVQMWTRTFQHPEQTGVGHWVDETLHRIKS